MGSSTENNIKSTNTKVMYDDMIVYLALPLEEAVLAQGPVEGLKELVQLLPVVPEPYRQISVVCLCARARVRACVCCVSACVG